jgi:succinate dehydrogenase / fumarate reductase cytochrome b subunit
MPDRPLSPHVWMYKFKYTLFTSILNRVAGCALTAGLLILVYWLMALASGAESYSKAVVVLSHPLLKLIYVGLAFTFSYHLMAGVRHLVWDTGRGLEKRQSQQSAWLIGALSVVLTFVLVAWAHYRMVNP